MPSETTVDSRPPPAPASSKQEGSTSGEGVEVVLSQEGSSAVVETPERPPPRSSESIFRHPVRPRPMRHPAAYHSGSWGYPPPPPHDYHRYGSFDGGEHPPPQHPPPHHYPPHHQHPHPPPHHYTSPHVQYPSAAPTEHNSSNSDVNVVSPNHATPRGRPYHPHHPPPPPHHHYAYQYPPTSPVSRPGGASAPRLRHYAQVRRATQENYSTHYVQDSFDSSQQSPHSPKPEDPYYAFYGAPAASWGSFDSAAAPPPEYAYGTAFPESPYSPYYDGYGAAHSFSYDDHPSAGGAEFEYDNDKHHHPHHHHHHHHVTPVKSSSSSSSRRKSSGTPVASNTTTTADLPAAASEVDFVVTDPPVEPVTPPGETSVCDSLAAVNGYDVLCGRGGGTNSQIGNRRFRQLVHEFQPTYLAAKRKEKPLLARTIVLIIRGRGGRFLKKNEQSGELYEVGDVKAEAKTSQALREGLDVRATRSQKKMQKKQQRAESPPVLPRLEEQVAPTKTKHAAHASPEHAQFRKRRRMRSTDRFFPDFCPPRADLQRALADEEDDDDDDEDDHVVVKEDNTNKKNDVPSATCDAASSTGCAGIAMDLVTGAATGSFCLTPQAWRR